MSVQAAGHRGGREWGALTGPLLGAAACGTAALAATGLVVVAGPMALLVPAVAALIGLAVFAPRHACILLLIAGVAFEPDALDYTRPLSLATWHYPESVRAALPLTVTPFETYLALVATSLCLRTRREPLPQRLPLLLWAVPAVMLLGALYGLRHGAPTNLIYNEARGLIFGLLAFVCVLRFDSRWQRTLTGATLIAGGALAAITLQRYFLFTRSGTIDRPLEFAYAHESAVFFGIAFVFGSLLFLHSGSLRERLLLAGFCLLVLAAAMATGRRSATMVLAIGMVVMAWQLLPRYPLRVLTISIPVAVLILAYLAAFWHTEYGALAQPARAVRSQIAPSERDRQSDLYRTNELANIKGTLAATPLFGVGFGKPFYQYTPLPNLETFWPLQRYVPHQNVLWLWLKMGLAGIAVFLGVWALALARCMKAIRHAARAGRLPVAPVALACALAMFLAFARVDHVVSTRGFAAFCVVVALCFTLPQPNDAEETPHATG